MSLETLNSLGAGGSGFQGTGAKSAAKMITELQGLNVSVLAGASADTKIDLAAIRSVDTIVACVESAAGALTDRTANTTINTLFATGSLGANTIVAGSECSVAGQSYVFAASATGSYGSVAVGADDGESCDNLADAINAFENSIERGGAQVVAVSNGTDTVTITATAEGTAGNSIALTTEDGTITVSGATLTGGTATGGIQIDVDTTGDSILLIWFDKG